MIIHREAAALSNLAARLDAMFGEAVQRLVDCRGCVVVSGLGKAGLVGQKIASTLSSTGTPSHFIHPVEALHGDLGRVRAGDLGLLLSYSGSTAEILQLLDSLHALGLPIIAITGRATSPLSQRADLSLHVGPVREAGDLELAPTTSTTAMLALGDALALVASQLRGFSVDDFARFHPGGFLGRKLARVEDVMRGLDRCRIADQSEATRQVLVRAGRPGRRTGAVMLVDAEGVLRGIFTDSDLARLFEQRRESALDQPIQHVMTRSPTTIQLGSMLDDARDLLVANKISELPVIDPSGRPCGLIDITDVMELGPDPAARVFAGTQQDAEPTVPFRLPPRARMMP
jgi:arabinose-5-phosphate isomerase